MPQLFINNFVTQFIASVKAAPDTASPALELDYGILRVPDGAAGVLLNPGAGNWYVLTAFKRSGSLESSYEVLHVTGVDNSVIGECRLTVLRGQEGTAPSAYIAGDIVELRLTAGGMGQYVQGTDARLSNARTPIGSAGGVLSGDYPNPSFAQAMATQAGLDTKAPLTGVGASGTWPISISGEAATAAAAPWSGITGKPAVIAAGADAAAARAAIGAAASGETVSAVRQPVNTTPAAAATGITETPTLIASTYYSLYGIAMSGSQWQVSTVADFATTVISTGDIAGSGLSYTLGAGALSVNSVYYWRVRYKDAEGVYSTWSAPTSFTTAASFNSYIATPTATPAAFGDPLEGGFYAGLVWNELVQSASSTAIGTGAKTFTVADMTSSPIVYAGQQLEVRSRANPANKMVGTVTGATGAALTVNVTGVGGAGTFADWSIMARFRVITAPKASGENASIAYKNANTAAPAATGTLTEGRKATLAMVGADTSTVYPAAHWCNNLNIGGKTDWYLPARDELETCWRNLKPTTDANYVTENRPAAATPNYANLGSYGDTAATHGLNNNSAPAGAAYTSGSPAQTAATAFRTGGAEAFEYGSSYYWSSTEYSASNAWFQFWNSSVPGGQSSNDKTNAIRARAVRRSII